MRIPRIRRTCSSNCSPSILNTNLCLSSLFRVSMDNSGGAPAAVNGLAPPPPPSNATGNTSPSANGTAQSGGNTGNGATTNNSSNSGNSNNNNDTSSHGGSNNSGRSTPSNRSDDNSPGKLFVGGLSWQTTQEKLRDYFSQFGTVTDVLVMKDPVTQVSQSVSSRQPCAFNEGEGCRGNRDIGCQTSMIHRCGLQCRALKERHESHEKADTRSFRDPLSRSFVIPAISAVPFRCFPPPGPGSATPPCSTRFSSRPL